MGAAAIILLLFIGVNMFRSLTDRDDATSVPQREIVVAPPTSEPNDNQEVVAAPITSSEEPSITQEPNFPPPYVAHLLRHLKHLTQGKYR